MEKRSKIYLEIIRIISIFLVILNHTPGCKLPEWNNQFGIAYYWFAMLVCEIDKMAVPMFLMISGALLLPKVETVGEWFHRRVLRFVYAICIVVLFQYVYYVHASGDTYSLQGVVSVFVRGSSINDFKVLWFLKVYVIIMLLLPLLRLCCRRLSPRFFGGGSCVAASVLCGVACGDAGHGEVLNLPSNGCKGNTCVFAFFSRLLHFLFFNGLLY